VSRLPFQSCYISKDKKNFALPIYHHDNIFYRHYAKQIIVVVSSRVAERIVDDILSTNDEILAISIIDKKGNILAAKSKESFKKAFGVTEDGDRYGATLAIGILSLVNEVKEIVGEAQAIITIHRNCKMMLLPIPLHEILAGLVLQPSVNAEDYNIANQIEILLADALKSSQEPFDTILRRIFFCFINGANLLLDLQSPSHQNEQITLTSFQIIPRRASRIHERKIFLSSSIR
jgi:hypothetical protein